MKGWSTELARRTWSLGSIRGAWAAICWPCRGGIDDPSRRRACSGNSCALCFFACFFVDVVGLITYHHLSVFRIWWRVDMLTTKVLDSICRTEIVAMLRRHTSSALWLLKSTFPAGFESWYLRFRSISNEDWLQVASAIISTYKQIQATMVELSEVVKLRMLIVMCHPIYLYLNYRARGFETELFKISVDTSDTQDTSGYKMIRMTHTHTPRKPALSQNMVPQSWMVHVDDPIPFERLAGLGCAPFLDGPKLGLTSSLGFRTCWLASQLCLLMNWSVVS